MLNFVYFASSPCLFHPFFEIVSVRLHYPHLNSKWAPFGVGPYLAPVSSLVVLPLSIIYYVD